VLHPRAPRHPRRRHIYSPGAATDRAFEFVA
jgi:hypothetical protein